MRAFYVAKTPIGERADEELRSVGLVLERIGGPPGLADALVALEPRLGTAASSVVVLGDDSDLSLAAALVAAKLELPLAATAAALDPASRNGRLLARLAEAAIGDHPSEIAAWARAEGGDSTSASG